MKEIDAPQPQPETALPEQVSLDDLIVQQEKMRQKSTSGGVKCDTDCSVYKRRGCCMCAVNKPGVIPSPHTRTGTRSCRFYKRAV